MLEGKKRRQAAALRMGFLAAGRAGGVRSAGILPAGFFPVAAAQIRRRDAGATNCEGALLLVRLPMEYAAGVCVTALPFSPRRPP